jgi:flagellar motor switch protein FliN/FliY
MTPNDAGAQEMRARIAGYTADALAGALNGLTGGGFEVVPLEGRPAEAPPAEGLDENALVWRESLTVADGAALWLTAGQELWYAVGQLVLGGDGAEAASEEDCRSTWNEVADQTTGGVARLLSGLLKREIEAQDGAPEKQQSDDAQSGAMDGTAVEIRHRSGNWRVEIRWNEAFARGCEVSAEPAPSGAGGKAAGNAGAAAAEAISSKTLDLLMDVALPVSVSFGKTSLQVREVLKLNTGSVVELDRLVSEPVEVIVNNCVIARGEVVVVDGNYGVRVIQLASRADRLRTGVSEATSRLGTGVR